MPILLLTRAQDNYPNNNSSKHDFPFAAGVGIVLGLFFGSILLTVLLIKRGICKPVRAHGNGSKGPMPSAFNSSTTRDGGGPPPPYQPSGSSTDYSWSASNGGGVCSDAGGGSSPGGGVSKTEVAVHVIRTRALNGQRGMQPQQLLEPKPSPSSLLSPSLVQMLPSWLFKVKAAFKRPSARTRPSEEADRLQPSEIASAVNVASGPAACDATASIEEHGPSSVKPDHSPVESTQEPPESHGFNPALIPSTSDLRATTSPSALHTPGGGSNFFTNSHGFTIHKQNITHGAKAVSLRRSSFAHRTGASHNSGERCDAPKCHPETRVAVKEEILDWIAGSDKGDEPKKILDMSSRGLLAASFFFSSFSGSANRRVKRCLVATVAYQLSCHPGLEPYKERLVHAIEMDPAILELRLEDQVEALVLQPLQEVLDQCDLSTLPKIIAVDGVDEVEAEQYHDPTRRQDVRTNEEDHLDILNTLLRCAYHPSFPFRILVASRPERVFEDILALEAKAITYKVFLDSKYDPDADIRLFLNASFSKMRRRYRLSSTWPTREAIDWIVDKASGQFIFAATVVRFVGDSSYLPQQQLERVLQLQVSEDGGTNPFGPLDSLYAHVLNSGPNPKLAVTWIRLIENLHGPLSGRKTIPAFYWRMFFETVEGEFEYLMGAYSSLIFTPTDENTSTFQLYHKSLLDFLVDDARSKALFVERESIRQFWLDASMRVFRRSYDLSFAHILDAYTRVDKGPYVQRSSAETERFLGIFLMKALMDLVAPSTIWWGSEVGFVCLIDILFSLCPPEDLTSLDAAWWIRLILSGFDLGGRPTEGGGVLAGFTEDVQPVTLYRLYEIAHSQCNPHACNIGCKRWRSAILSEAKQLGWCVHGLEEIAQVSTRQQGFISLETWLRKFHVAPVADDGSTGTCFACFKICYSNKPKIRSDRSGEGSV
ncbi:hypothetical protein NMY22_g14426 [Coprinellus aureogranulatus]|nr:hypothetical protein NMY22_g14426 [Coprinellus aureogranulatus]